MVGVLILFAITNVIWAIFVVYLVSLIQNKSLPNIFPHKPTTPVETEYGEATDEQIAQSLSDLRSKIKLPETAFDTNGTKVPVKEERAVE